MSANLPKASKTKLKEYIRLNETALVYVILNMCMPVLFHPVEWLKDDYHTVAVVYLVLVAVFSLFAYYQMCACLYRSFRYRQQYDFS